MAYKGKIIHNSKTGQTLEFITTSKDSNGKLLEMISTYKPRSNEPAPHYHPLQNERFVILKGAMNVRMNGAVTTLKKDDSIDIPAKTVHSMWNDSNDEAAVRWSVMPALNTEYFFETLTRLSNDDKTNDEGVPSILNIAPLATKYNKEFRLAKPAYFIQKVIFTMLTFIASLKGNTSVYRKYID